MNLWLRSLCRRSAPAFIAAAALCALARTGSAEEVLPCRDFFRPGLQVADAEGCGAKTSPRLRRADGASELLNLGIRHAEAGRHGQALEALREAARLRPRWALAHYNLGVISLEALKDRQVAEEQYEALRELSPPLAEKLRSLMGQ